MASKASGFLGLEVSCLPFCIITSLVFNHRSCLRSTGPQLFSSLLCSQFILKHLTWERPEKLHNDYFRNSVPGQNLPCWWSFRSLCCAFGLVHSPVTHLFLWAAAFSGSPDPATARPFYVFFSLMLLNSLVGESFHVCKMWIITEAYRS